MTTGVPDPPETDYRGPLPALVDAISALENYGDHHEWCAQRLLRVEPAICNCGFTVKMVVLREQRDRAEALYARLGQPSGRLQGTTD